MFRHSGLGILPYREQIQVIASSFGQFPLLILFSLQDVVISSQIIMYT